MRFRKSFSAVCYHFGRDAVRPKRAETTLQKYTIFSIRKSFLNKFGKVLCPHPCLLHWRRGNGLYRLEIIKKEPYLKKRFCRLSERNFVFYHKTYQYFDFFS